MQTVVENKVFLISTLSADASFILQYVQQEKIITTLNYNSLNQSNHTQQKIATNLLDMVINKGNTTCCRFVDLLQKKQIQDNFPELQRLFIPTPSQNQDNLVKAANEVDDYYPMTRRPLGYCLIINNYNFENKSNLKNRKGTDADKDALTQVFGRMHFLVEERRDLSSSDMLNVVMEFSLKDHSNMDAFVCCILSHGEKGRVLGIDGNPVLISDFTQPFALCSTLKGKPKLFFIQACQWLGSDSQGAVWKSDSFIADANPVPVDFMIGMATVESYRTFRHTVKGSIYIQELCTHLKNGCPRKEDILSILTRVNRSVSTQDLNQHKQIPEPRYTLTKKLVLPMD